MSILRDTKLVMLALTLIIVGTLSLLPVTIVQATSLVLSPTPLFVTTSVLPNVMVVLDNSESMDGNMVGKLIAGDDPTTRSNIARTIMRNTITNYRQAFKWGLMSFNINSIQFYNTYAYYLGSDTGMIFTDACSGSPLKTAGGKRCIVNPTPFVGGGYVTYDKAGDDANVNDVLYTSAPNGSNCALTTVGGLTYCNAIWALTDSSADNYFFYGFHTGTTSWATSSFSGCPLGTCSSIGLTQTDAGYLPHNPPITRQVYIPRAWGYGANNSGGGIVNEPIALDSVPSHFTNLMTYLGSETSSNASAEIKNASTFTPLAGTMQSVKTYFSGASTPVQYTCQKNFVMLITDGNPTADTSGNPYSVADQASGKPLNDTVAAITALKNTSVSPFPTPFNIKTYVVGLGDSVQNPTSIAALNAMAVAGDASSSTAYLATNSAAFTAAIDAIANSITAQVGSGSAVSLNSTQISTSSQLYQGRFSSIDWHGQLLAYPINTDGSLGAVAWDAGNILNGQNWNTGRVILTYNSTTTNSTGRGIPFRWPANPLSPTSTELNLNQIVALNKNSAGTADGQGQLRLQYLRGDKSNEGASPLFRSRTASVLGDIVDSNAAYVGKPQYSYPDSMEAASYTAFAQSTASRTKMVYVGANDGMLHGFDATSGTETLAYVPTAVYANLSKLTAPNYSHSFYVDGSPTVGDVFYGGAWHSVLVGSLRGGGQGIFALDVTNPGTFTEPNAANIVLWEFNDIDDGTEYDLGFTYTQPMIVKMANGKWAAVFGNGYNNTTADGHASSTGNAAIYIVDIQTGALIKKLYTNTGSSSTSNGFATVTPVDVNGDNITDYIYGGDLLGNVWKFDVRSTSPSSWTSSYTSGATPIPLFTAKDASNNPQPITGKITVGRNPVSGYMVYFGTGEYLAVSDLASTAQQTFYGIWDNGAAVSGRSVLLQQSVTSTSNLATGTFRLSSSNGLASTMFVSPLSKKGWYIDLPTSGERQVTDPLLNDGNIVFSTLIPNTSVCSSGGSGWIMELDAVTGNMIDSPVFPTSNVNFSASDVPTAGVQTSAIPSTPRVINKQGVSYGSSGNGNAFGTQKKLTSQSDGSIGSQTEKSVITQKRIMWRQTQ